MTKRELLGRTAAVISRLRTIHAGSSQVARDLDELDRELDRLEKDLGEQIDNFMAARYQEFNVLKYGRRRASEYQADMRRQRTLDLGLSADHMGPVG